MKALILSGGTGSRLRPLTYTGAKQLIPLANQPILGYVLSAIRDAGISEAVLVVGSTRDEVKAYVGDGSAFGLSVTYVEQDAPRGLAHAVQISEEALGGSPFVMFLGDNVLLHGIAEEAAVFRAHPEAHRILLAQVPEPQRFGVAVLEGEKVVRLVEKPKVPPSSWALVGVYFFRPEIFAAVKAIPPSARGEYEITDAIQYLIDNGKQVVAGRVRGWWKDTGKPEDVLEANRMMLEHRPHFLVEGQVTDSTIEGRVSVAPTAIVTRSTLRGPCIIGEGARIDSCYIGPYTAVGENCHLERCEVEHSIIMTGATVRDPGMRIDSSLIGKNVRVEHHDHKPKAMRLLLGENSQVLL